MDHEPTAFHPPIVLADHRSTRRVRAGRVCEDFAFSKPSAMPGQQTETADEIEERLQRRLRATEPVAGPWLRGLVVAAFLTSACLVVMALLSLFL